MAKFLLSDGTDIEEAMATLRAELGSLQESDVATARGMDELRSRVHALEARQPVPDPDAEPSPQHVWLSPEQIYNLPDAGSGWQLVQRWADRADEPVLCDQNNQGNAIAVAAAVVAVRRGDQLYTTKVGNYLNHVVGTEDRAGCAEGGKLLALGRNLAGYVVAAQLLGYRPSHFVEWLAQVIEKPLWETIGVQTLVEAALGPEAWPNNHGTAYRMSLLAAAHYLGDEELVSRSAEKFHDWLGRSSAGFRWDPQAGDQVWHASYPDVSSYRGINPAGSWLDIDGVVADIDGCLPEDMKRSGPLTYPYPRENYVVEGLSYALVEAHMLAQLGYDIWEWEDRALYRAMRWLHSPHFVSKSDREGTEWEFAFLPADEGDAELSWIINSVYGTQYPASIGGPGKSGLGHWPWIYGGVSG